MKYPYKKHHTLDLTEYQMCMHFTNNKLKQAILQQFANHKQSYTHYHNTFCLSYLEEFLPTLKHLIRGVLHV